VSGVETEKELAAADELSLQIAQKKIPFLRSPHSAGTPVNVEADRERGDPIEFPFEIRQGLEWLDHPNNARNVEQIDQLCEKRHPLSTPTPGQNDPEFSE